MNRSVFFFVCFVFSFLFGCDDAQQMVSPVIDGGAVEVVETLFPSVDSRYTGVLYRVGTVENFGRRVEDPMALEWNGIDLYMLAEYGNYPNEGEYLFRVDRNTGAAGFVNTGARDLGGSFTQGRVFTQVKGVSPDDLAWRQGFGDSGEMFGVCFVVDAIVSIDVETGLAGRINDGFLECLDGDEGVLEGQALGYNGVDFFMSGTIQNLSGEKFLGLSRISGNLGCPVPIVEITSPQLGPVYPVAMCWDGDGMYVSEMHTQSLCILDLETGEVSLVGKWVYSELPLGYYIQDKNTGRESGLTEMPLDHDGRNYHYVNRAKNVGFDFPDITGIAFDGQDMYVVDYFTDALYRVGRN